MSLDSGINSLSEEMMTMLSRNWLICLWTAAQRAWELMPTPRVVVAVFHCHSESNFRTMWHPVRMPNLAACYDQKQLKEAQEIAERYRVSGRDSRQLTGYDTCTAPETARDGSEAANIAAARRLVEEDGYQIHGGRPIFHKGLPVLVAVKY